jgi:hypothetical protein
MALPAEYDHDSDLQYHYRTYRNFVLWVLVFAAHALVILALLAWFLA